MKHSFLRRAAAVLAALAALVIFGGCARKAAVLYDSGVGLTLTMHEGMVPFEAEGAVMALADDDCMMTVRRESLEDYAAGGLDLSAMTTAEYADLTAEANGIGQQFDTDENGNLYVSYNARMDGVEYYYHTVLYRGSDAFWLVTFACFEEVAEDYAGLFTEWSGSVTLP